MRAAAGGGGGAGGGKGGEGGDDEAAAASTQQGERQPLGPAERAAARACIDGLKCMSLLLRQNEAGVGALLAEMAGGAGGEEGGETLRALAALAGGLHTVRGCCVFMGDDDDGRGRSQQARQTDRQTDRQDRFLCLPPTPNQRNPDSNPATHERIKLVNLTHPTPTPPTPIRCSQGATRPSSACSPPASRRRRGPASSRRARGGWTSSRAARRCVCVYICVYGCGCGCGCVG